MEKKGKDELFGKKGRPKDKETHVKLNLKLIGLWESEYKSVNKLLKYLNRDGQGYLATRKNFLQHLNRFCFFVGKNPDQLVKMSNKEIEYEIQQYISNYDWIPSKKTLCVALKRFFIENNRRKINYPKLKSYRRSRKNPHYIPTKKEAYKMFEYAGSLKYKALIGSLRDTGNRNSTVRAIKVGKINTNNLNLLEYTIKNQLKKNVTNLVFIITQGMKDDVPDACKKNIEYFVFTSKETTEAIKLYLEDRKRKYGKLEDDEFLFPSRNRGTKKGEDVKTPITAKGILKIVKVCAKRAGIKDWKYVTPQLLRKTCNEILGNQKSENSITFEQKEFFMGHVLPGTSDYYFNTGIDKRNIEKLRKIFSKLSFKPEPELNIEIIKEFASLNDIDFKKVEHEANKRTNGKPTLEDIKMIIREFNAEKNKVIDKIISIDNLQNYLNQGYAFLSNLNNGQVVVRKNGQGDNNPPMFSNE